MKLEQNVWSNNTGFVILGFMGGVLFKNSFVLNICVSLGR